MAGSLALEQSCIVPVGVDEAFARTLPLYLPSLLNRWYGPVPPVVGVRDEVGDWKTPGQTRFIVMKGGGGFHEELTKVDPPDSFGYLLTAFAGPLGLLIDRAEGDWSFTANGAGTTVTWRWMVYPRWPLTAPLLPLVGFLWKGYAGKALENLPALLTG
jgi:hypothetical protein